MDLRKEWQKLQEEKFIQSSIKKEDIMNAIYQESNSTISTLRKRLKAKMNWTLFFLIGFGVFILFNLQNSELVLLLSIFFGAYLLGFVGMWSQYRQMSTDVDFSQPTLDLMKTNDQLMRRALNVERVFGVIFFSYRHHRRHAFIKSHERRHDRVRPSRFYFFDESTNFNRYSSPFDVVGNLQNEQSRLW